MEGIWRLHHLQRFSRRYLSSWWFWDICGTVPTCLSADALRSRKGQTLPGPSRHVRWMDVDCLHMLTIACVRNKRHTWIFSETLISAFSTLYAHSCVAWHISHVYGCLDGLAAIFALLLWRQHQCTLDGRIWGFLCFPGPTTSKAWLPGKTTSKNDWYWWMFHLPQMFQTLPPAWCSDFQTLNKSKAVGASVSPADPCITCLPMLRRRLSQVKWWSDAMLRVGRTCSGWGVNFP